MKTIIIAALIAASAAPAFAGSVNGYYRKNGTYVAPHYRSDPNNTVRDNYTYDGNTNPYTGKVGTDSYSSECSDGFC